MILNTTMWVEARLGVDIQKEIAFTYANVLAVHTDQRFTVYSDGGYCMIAYECGGRHVVRTQAVYFGADLDVVMTSAVGGCYLGVAYEYEKVVEEENGTVYESWRAGRK